MPTTVQPDRDKAKWTVMAYLAGDNDLAEEMVLALQQIKGRSKAKPLWPEIKVVALFDPTALGIPTQRFVFSDPPPNKAKPFADMTTLLDSFSLEALDSKELNEINTGNPAALSGFIQWAVTDPKRLRTRKKGKKARYLGPCEAEHYALILSGHGSGATEEVFLTDENPEDALSILELETALSNARHLIYLTENRTGKKPLSARTLRSQLNDRLERKLDPPKPRFDVLGLDACFMNMVEICYELREHADFVVGAEGFEPEFGWPYDRIVEKVKSIGADELGPELLAQTIVEEYVGYYSDFDKTAGRSVDLAAICTAELNGIKTPLGKLASSLKDALEFQLLREQIVLAHWEAQSYKFDQYVDLYDLCECLSARFCNEDLPDEEKGKLGAKKTLSLKRSKKNIVDACREVAEAVKRCVLVSACSGYAYQHSHGLSIYFPWAEVPHDYSHLGLVVDTGWGKFLEDYVKATCRPTRPGFTEPNNKMWRKIESDECAALCLDKLADSGNKYGRRVGKYGRRVGKYGRRVGKYGRRVGKYGRRVGKYSGDRDKSVKNFPLVYGHAIWKPEEACPENKNTD